jgi:RluA family pseudouridine synthase
VAGKSCPHCFKTTAEQMAATIARRHEAIHRAVTPLPGSKPYDNFRPINVPADCDGRSLVDALCRVVRHISRIEWTRDCALGLVVDDSQRPVGASRLVQAGERYLHKFPNIVEPDVNGRIEILHEDEALIVVNKPAPLPMHAAGRFNRNTLQYILNAVYYPDKPKQAHRLDANTTGVVLLTRTRHFAAMLQPQFARGQVEKFYLVRVQGHPPEDAFSCEAPISAEPGEVGTREVDMQAGLPARTNFRVLRRAADGTALLEARPLTGRTNQIRVHLWHLGFPVCGDAVYLPGIQIGTTQTLAVDAAPLCLHSWRVTFAHPLTKERVEFTAPPPSWAA